MAKQVIERLIDDLDGGDAEETVPFALDGVSYEIDLSSKNAKKLRTALESYVEHARKPSALARRGKAARPASNRERSADIRSWAKQRGIAVNERGRIPAQVVQQYEDAH
jgi:Lsr2